MYLRSLVHPYVQSLLSSPIEALFDSASEFGNEGRRSKEEEKKKGGMSAFDKRIGRVSAHSLGRASSALRSKRLKDGQTALRRVTGKSFKGALEGEENQKAMRGAVARHVTCEKAC